MIAIDLSGATVLVTGGGGGLGSAIARRFLEAGAAVVAQTRSFSPALDNLGREYPALHVVCGDLEDESFVVGLFADAAPHGPVDVLINSAGVYPSGPLLETSSSEFARVVRSNAGLAFACLSEAARSMRNHGGGSIVNIASLNASRPSLHQAPYNSAKAAVVNLSRSAAVELAPYGIRVNAVSPGLIDRRGLADSWPAGVRSWVERCPAGRLGRAQDVADACVFLASPLSSWITGHELVVDGGISASPPY